MAVAPAVLSRPGRPATHRAATSMLGMTIFVASWAMLFAGLFFAYAVVRLRSPGWPPADLPRLPRALPGLATIVLAASGFALGHRRILMAALLGTSFLGLQAVVWRDLWQAGLHIDTGTYASVFYAFTVFHALHVLVGIGALLALGIRSAANGPLRMWTIYWHGVGVVWGAMYVGIYLL